PDSGWELTEAYDINDNGAIVGRGSINGRTRDFLVTRCFPGDDSDGDGVPDVCDTCPGGDDNQDSDGDGTPDFCDGCPYDPEKTEPGPCGCGALDIDDDGDVDLDDHADFASCMSGPGVPFAPRVHVATGMVGSVTVEPDPCIGFDADGDCDIDLDDYALLQWSFTGSH
ncbi:MAG: thrombospondin type 3 repeat-containing protein, partial [Planctomycetota bacterium]